MAMVVGYPIQTDQEIDLMYESESARMWEEQNSRSDAWDRMLDAVGYINVALEHLNKATSSLVSAKDQVDGLPAECRLGSLIDDYENLVCDLQNIRQRFINGEG